MKKQKSSIIVLSCSESSGDESEKAKPKIDKEELRKYLQNSDEEDEFPQKTSPKKSKKFVKKRKTSSLNNTHQDKSSEEIKKQKKPIQKDSPPNYLLKGDDFKRLQKAKKLGAVSLDYSQRKNNMVEYDNKKIHFGSVNIEDFITHKDPDRRDQPRSQGFSLFNWVGGKRPWHRLVTCPSYTPKSWV